MILKKLTLENFGIYKGIQEFDLIPKTNNGTNSPIILVGGINGGGKTTFLDAIRLVLYGNRARCSKRNNKSYDEHLMSVIHRNTDPFKGSKLKLSFSYITEGKEIEYTIIRTWRKNKRSIDENIKVIKNGSNNIWLSKNWNNIVETLIPIGISDLCFFDAEKIRFLADDQSTSMALSGAIKSLLGLDLAEQLSKDTKVLEGRIVKRVYDSPKQSAVNNLENEAVENQNLIDEYVQKLAALENDYLKLSKELNIIEEQFENAGGNHWKNRNTNLLKDKELKQIITAHKNDLVSIVSKDLPLIIIKDLLTDIKIQADLEDRVSNNALIINELKVYTKNLLKTLKKDGTNLNTVNQIKSFLKKQEEKFDLKLNVNKSLNISNSCIHLINSLLDFRIDQAVTRSKEMLQKYELLEMEKENIERNLSSIPEEKSIARLLNNIKEITKKSAYVEGKKEHIAEHLKMKRNKKEEIEKTVTEVRRKIIDEEIKSEEDARLAKLLSETQNVMEKYLELATKRKIDALSRAITQSFKFLLHKQSLVQRVEIDPINFTIKIYDINGDNLEKNQLSEGEKQLFAVSILWGLAQSSNRSLPLIIDTPMARLDVNHRDNLVERYFPHASHQVIILSTDTEIDKKYFNKLSPFITKSYHLEYFENDKSTIPKEGYFWTQIAETPVM